jgi:ribosome-binding factor A
MISNNQKEIKHRKKEHLYEREIISLFQENKIEEGTLNFFVNRCVLSATGDCLKICIDFFEKKERGRKILKKLNKKYVILIKRNLAKSGMFSFLPSNIFFDLDDEFNLDELEEILEKIKKNE